MIRKMNDNRLIYKEIRTQLLNEEYRKELKKESLFRRFHYLAEKWKKETLIYSDMNMIESNDSYLEIINVGKDILPYIFQDLKENGGFWFSALEKFTGVNPIKPEHKGIINLMVEDWLNWAEENGYM